MRSARAGRCATCRSPSTARTCDGGFVITASAHDRRRPRRRAAAAPDRDRRQVPGPQDARRRRSRINTRPRGRMSKDIIKRYSNGEITVVWQPSLCVHSGICARGLPKVFDPRRRPWVILDGFDYRDDRRSSRALPVGRAVVRARHTTSRNSPTVREVADYDLPAVASRHWDYRNKRYGIPNQALNIPHLRQVAASAFAISHGRRTLCSALFFPTPQHSLRTLLIALSIADGVVAVSHLAHQAGSRRGRRPLHARLRVRRPRSSTTRRIASSRRSTRSTACR